MSIDNYHPSRDPASSLTRGLLMEESAGAREPSPKKSTFKRTRLVSLDMVRGLTIAMMILVDELGDVYPSINHSPWNNVTLADFVMPWFLFMVGTSMAFSLRRYTKRNAEGNRNMKLVREGSKKVIIRSIKLYLLGVLLQGGDWIDSGVNDPNKANRNYGWNLTTIRFCGILNRIAYSFLVVGLCELWLPRISLQQSKLANCCTSPHIQVFVRHAWLWLVGIGTLILYLLITFLT